MKDYFLAIFMIFCVAICLLIGGYVNGYTHVIKYSEAYLIENGDVVALRVDGQEYQYVITPEFYNRLSY